MAQSLPVSVGQSLLEYSVCIGLVLSLSLGALFLMSKNLNRSINTIIPERSVGSASKPVSGMSGPVINAANVQPASGGIGLISAERLLELTDKVQTMGANGVTDYLALQLEALIKARHASQQLTDAQANLLLKLAAQGHRLASLEKAVEDATKQVSQSSELNGFVVQVEGKSYTVEQVRALIGYAPSLKTDNLFDTAAARQETLALIHLYEEAGQAGALQDLQVMQEVTSLVSQIAYISEMTDDAAYETVIGAVSPSNFAQGLTSKIELTSAQVINTFNPASSLTEKNADHICNIGLVGGECL